MRFALSTLVLLVSVACVAGQAATVTHVSDGDSFIIASGDRVRMIGVDAPELADAFGKESKNHLTGLIRGKTVMLERDPLNNDRDVHGRLLRIVTLNSTDINKQMISDGYARALIRYRFDRARQADYREAELNAMSERRGIWALSLNGDPYQTATPVVETPTESTPAAESTPVWPKFCSGSFVVLLMTFMAVRRHRDGSR